MIFMWNLLTWMWNLDPKPSRGTSMRTSLCEAFVRNLHNKPFCKTFMWKLGEAGVRFRAAAPNHPEALLEEPQAFQVVGE